MSDKEDKLKAAVEQLLGSSAVSVEKVIEQVWDAAACSELGAAAEGLDKLAALGGPRREGLLKAAGLLRLRVTALQRGEG